MCKQTRILENFRLRRVTSRVSFHFLKPRILIQCSKPRILFWMELNRGSFSESYHPNHGSLPKNHGSIYQTADPKNRGSFRLSELNRGSWIRGIRGYRGSNDTLAKTQPQNGGVPARCRRRQPDWHSNRLTQCFWKL